MLRKLTPLISNIPYRTLHLSPVRKIDPNNVKEIKIPVPWGHIAGKWWGDEHKRPILAIHGWQDNAGSFDGLAQEFPDTRPVLAIDLPGHGLSSHLPAGQLYGIFNDVALIRRIQKHFSWDKVTLLAHSRGLDVSSTFAAMYPDVVDCLIGIDLIMPFCIHRINKLGKLIETTLVNLSYDLKNNREYTEDEIKFRWINATRGSLNEYSAVVLMKRAITKNSENGKFTFTRDNRLKIGDLCNTTPEQARNIITKLKCHYLVIKFSNGRFYSNAFEHVPDILDVVKASALSFELHEVEGTHHGHMNRPDLVAPIITKFLERV